MSRVLFIAVIVVSLLLSSCAPISTPGHPVDPPPPGVPSHTPAPTLSSEPTPSPIPTPGPTVPIQEPEVVPGAGGGETNVETLSEPEAVTETINKDPTLLAGHTTTVEVTKDVEYGRVGDIPLLLDIYTPETPITTPLPAIVWIHGGSFKYGNKSSDPMLRSIKTLAKHGFFAISIDYRLSGVAPFPAAVEDSKCAVRWLRANAEKYNIDPNRIGVLGSSAGGHLSMMVGCADETAGLEGNGGWAEFSSRVQAICSYYGPTDLVSAYRKIEAISGSVPDNHHFVQFLDSHLDEKPDLWKAASPINHVTADDPPLLLVHGELDSVVPIIVAEKTYWIYRRTGLEAILIRVSDADHVFRQATDTYISPSLEEIEQIVLDFFVKHLLRTR